MAVSDSRTTHIPDEAAFVASLLPEAQLFFGADATLDNFRRHAAGAKILHLAAHGIFRRDNPLFSAIRLADGDLNLIDLPHAGLDIDLVTLSACNSGSSVPVGGDELLGMTRGFLSAGARNLLVSLWEIDDAATKDFMKSFYTSLLEGNSGQHAARDATRNARSLRAHPYYWAPFMLVGGSA